MDALEKFIKPVASKLHLSTLPLHINDIATAYLLYEVTFRLISPILSSYFSKSYRQLDRRGKTNWDVHVVSMLQCIIINSMALFVMFNDPEREHATLDYRERLWGYTSMTGEVQGFAAGYFLWDVIVSTLHYDVLGASSLLHGLSALFVTCLGFRPFANYYGINFVLYELSTPFLNLHWFMDKLGWTGSTAQLINGLFLIVSFFGCRLVWGAWQSALIYNDVWLAWNNQTHLSKMCEQFVEATRIGDWINVPWRCMVLPKWLGIFYVTANTTLTLLNMYWYSKMIAALRKRFETPKKVKQVDEKKTK